MVPWQDTDEVTDGAGDTMEAVVISDGGVTVVVTDGGVTGVLADSGVPGAVINALE